MGTEVWLWIGFHVLVAGMLAIDLGIFQRHAHRISIREAAVWSVVWVGTALVFNAGVWWLRGSQAGLEWLTGYLIEKALSVDNLFVFLVIFTYFAVPAHLQPRVLKWGILGAVLMRASLIAIGAVLVHRFHWILYLFGAFLVYTGFKLLRHTHETVDPSRNRALLFVRRFWPVTEDYGRGAFFEQRGGRLWVTPLVLVLVAIETTDLVFALDSIPAIFAITRDPFIVYTSNIFAILGLRAMFFLLAGILDMFRFLKYGLSVVLMFIGAKMLISDVYKIHVGVSLGVVALILAVSVLASIFVPKPAEATLNVPESADAPKTGG
ncbi:MAG: TerC family protein [Armatimonadota bacterium]|nr:TerC family protein [Armatimonadota bacterium]MDR5696901.1 TerC family protein [Armatimonadota bacterium]